MRIKLLTGESITAVLAVAATTTNPKAIVSREGRYGEATDVVALTDDTAVALLTSVDAAGDVLTSLTICNIDTATVTLTINKKISGTSYPIIKSLALGVNETLMMGGGDGNDITVIDSSGNIKLAFASSATTFSGNLTLADAVNIIVNATTGTKIGTSTSQKLGFFNATPVAQRSAYTQTYSTADKTHASRTAAALTVTDGAGTNDGTIGAITGDASVIAAVQELVAMINKVIVDQADTAQALNSVIDDLQALGLVG